MYIQQELLNSLFFDIETVPEYKSYDDLKKVNPELAKLWLKRKELIFKKNPDKFLGNEDENMFYLKHAGLYPEFSKVCCICFGTIIEKDSILKIKTGCYENHNERELLSEIADTVFGHKKMLNYTLAGFNIKNFDMPFLSKRYLINKLSLPKQLQNRGKKPWELKVLDLMDDWKMGGNEPISLELYCAVFGVKSPKDTIQNDEIGILYWEDPKDMLPNISKYCEKDIVATVKSSLSVSNLTFQEED